MSLRSRLRELTKSAAQHEADEIRRQSDRATDVAPTEIRDRHHAVVRGSVRSVTMPPQRSVPVLVAEVFDGERAVNLVWIGRRHIAGIVPGVFLLARGRVAMKRGTPTIFNPSYELLPR